MSRDHLSVIAAVYLLLTSALTLAGQAPQRPGSAPQIAFTVGMSKPHTHMFEVQIQVKRAAGSAPGEDILIMPVWTPGSYLIREFGRHVQDFTVVDAAGQPLQWAKIDKNSWRVVTNGVPEWRASYRVYANELTVRTSELNSEHAFWNNTTLLMYLKGFLSSPATVQVMVPEPWKIATQLAAVPGQKNTFRAQNFDFLYDSPFEASNFKTIAFDVGGVPHRIVIDGDGNYDQERLRNDVKKIVEAQLEMMGELPYPNYTIILHLKSEAGGGLEHLNSTALGFPRFNFKQESLYRGFLELVAHEVFHAWNVKRIRPDALGPFDYTSENYTKLLWVAEGISIYYQNLSLVRAGLLSDQEFLGEMAREIQDLQTTPGRFVMSAEDASFDTWIKFYRQDENSRNSQIDYYNKGAILGLLLDLEIRKLSKGQKSLDHVMRYLYNEFYKKDRNYAPPDFQKAVELMAGSSFEQFFNKYVRGREELNYDESLAAAGLRLDTVGASATQKATEKAYLGAELAQERDRLMVRSVLAGGPAYEQGLNAGDQIVALNNMRATKDFVEARIGEKRPGDPISLTIFRSDDLSTLLVKLGARIAAPYAIVPLANATDEQKAFYRSWLKVGSEVTVKLSN